MQALMDILLFLLFLFSGLPPEQKTHIHTSEHHSTLLISIHTIYVGCQLLIIYLRFSDCCLDVIVTNLIGNTQLFSLKVSDGKYYGPSSVDYKWDSG